MPEDGIEKLAHTDILSLEEIAAICQTFVQLGIHKIRLTGGEPLIRKGMLNLVNTLGQLPGLKDLCITTNGSLLPEMAADLKQFGITGINISIDSLKFDRFSALTRGGNLSQTLAGIDAALRAGFRKIKLNVVLIKGVNDDEIADFIALTQTEPLDVRFIELMPIGLTADWAKHHYLSNAIILERYPELIALPADYDGQPATHYQRPGAKGRVGLINPMSCQFCNRCDRLRLTATGMLRACLHHDQETDLKIALRESRDLAPLILNAVAAKPETHHLALGRHIANPMARIGG